jgi:FlaA1/EpsC-like NDP-sugar epimerase
VPERSNGAVSKTVVCCKVYRGFESHPLRQMFQGFRLRTEKKHIFWKITTGRGRSILVLVLDLLLLSVAFGGCLALFREWPRYSAVLGDMTPGLRGATLAGYGILWGFSGVWRASWRYTALHDVVRVLRVTLGASLLLTLACLVVCAHSPLIFYLVFGLASSAMLVAPRVAYRLYTERQISVRGHHEGTPALLVYGGHETALFIRDQQRTVRSRFHIDGILDASENYVGQSILGIPVLGALHDLPRIMSARESLSSGVLLLPSGDVPGWSTRRIVSVARAFGLGVGRVPDLSRVGGACGEKPDVCALEITDLLGRPPQALDKSRALPVVQGKVVCVTGAGGSIGSELVHQLSALGLSRLVCVDQGEFALYQLEQVLSGLPGCPPFELCVGDIRDPEFLDRVFEQNRPDLVFHAAALKHIPLMETNRSAAVLTNIGGTRHVTDACVRHKVAVMVQISTDKVVRPSSVMGASKRVAEMYAQMLDRRMPQGGTRFVTVRFGNVLGSHGSVVPLFQKQIAAGGPLTVTHPEMTRYFMSIAEAASLVIQGVPLALDPGWVPGQILVLDMGEPVRISDLARDMIHLAGGDPVEIVYTGVRPGEKMHEELFLPDEKILASSHPGIRVAVSIGQDKDALDENMAKLEEMARRGDDEGIRMALRVLIPDFDPSPLHA